MSALKSVDFPTFGRPTIPILSIVSNYPVGREKGRVCVLLGQKNNRLCRLFNDAKYTERCFEKQILLWAVDNRWIRHLTDLDRLREGIGLQAFAQVDPLVAYKREAFNMYGELMNDIRGDVVKAVLTLQLQPKQVGGQRAQVQSQSQGQEQPQDEAQQPQSNGSAVIEPFAPTPIAQNIRTNRDAPAAQTVRKTGPDVGRNDPCWCGSGKKYKNCHMNSDRAGGANGGGQAGGQKVAAGR